MNNNGLKAYYVFDKFNQGAVEDVIEATSLEEARFEFIQHFGRKQHRYTLKPAIDSAELCRVIH